MSLSYSAALLGDMEPEGELRRSGVSGERIAGEDDVESLSSV